MSKLGGEGDFVVVAGGHSRRRRGRRKKSDVLPSPLTYSDVCLLFGLVGEESTDWRWTTRVFVSLSLSLVEKKRKEASIPLY